MGQHKYNPTAKLAKDGKLLPLTPKIGKREAERMLIKEVTHVLYQKFPAIRYLWEYPKIGT